MTSMNKTARLAGLFWLLTALTTGFSLGYVRANLIVPGDAVATSANVVALQSLFRAGIVSYLFSQIFLFLFGLSIYALFRDVNRAWARLFLGSLLVAVAIAVMNVLNNLAALLLMGNAGYLNAFTPDQRSTLAMLFLRLNNSGIALLELFSAPYFFALGWLIVKSRYLPKVLGILVMGIGFGFVLNTLTKILVPDFQPAMFTRTAMLLGALGGIPTILWLLIRGVKVGAGTQRG
jgi:hypothetical protein